MNVQKSIKLANELNALCDEGDALAAECRALNEAGEIALDDPRFVRMAQIGTRVDELRRIAKKMNDSRRWN